MSLYIYCLHLIIPEADRDNANEMAATLGDDYVDTFTEANVSVGGSYPPTHIYVSARMKQDERNNFATILPQWESFGLSAIPQFWVISVETGDLLNSNTSYSKIGENWTIFEQRTFADTNVAWTVFPEE